MPRFLEPQAFIAHPGLRLTIVKDMPSPWCQAAKAILEIKGLDYVACHWLPGEDNPELSAWGHEATSPVVGWADEKPIHHWADILALAERLAPSLPLIPENVDARVLMFGLSHLICGRMGIGWNRRLQWMAPGFATDNPPEAAVRRAARYGFNLADADAASARLAASLGKLANQLKSQKARGSSYFIGNELTAVDIYWTSFASFFAPLPEEQCPMIPAWRPLFASLDEKVAAALDPILLEHRDWIFATYFHNPMEL